MIPRPFRGARIGRPAFLAALILMAACTAPPEPPQSFRDQTAVIASKAIFDAARFAGAWKIVAHYPSPGHCPNSAVSYAISGTDVTRHMSCPTARFAPVRGRLNPLGRMVFAGRDHWVLWADEGYRTAVIGAPDGQMAWVLNRDGQIPADRMRAAREILDFNGYDVSRLLEDYE